MLFRSHKQAVKDIEASLTDAKNAGVEKSRVMEIVNRIWEEEK